MSLPSPGTLWRTLRPLRRQQIVGQLRHRLRGRRDPRPWTQPAPALRARAAAAAFLPAPAHARLEPGPAVTLLHREEVFPGAIDWDHATAGPLWAYHLHQHEYLRDPALAPGVRGDVLLDWIERHPRGVGWAQHPISLRAHTWLALLMTPGALVLDPAQEERVRASLAAQLEHLAAHLETHLLANHYLSNLTALVLGGLALAGPGADRWLAHEGRLRRELAAQIGPDGAHEERSPMYHALLLEKLLDLANLAAAVPGRAPEPLVGAVRDAAARMLGALRVWTHPDGRIALFGDSAFGIAAEPGALAGYAASLGIAPRGPARDGLLEAARFVRLAAGPWHAIVTLGGPAPAHQPGHAHADALSFELSVGGARVVTDTGVAEYLPGALREASRATRSHATIEVGGRDQAELWAAHRVGGRPRVTALRAEPDRVAEAACAGWATRDTVHRRRLRVDERCLEIHDSLEGRPRAVRLVLPLAPGLEPELAADVSRVRLPSGERLEIALPRGPAWRVERLPYFPEFGCVMERAALVGRADRFPSGTWQLRLASG